MTSYYVAQNGLDYHLVSLKKKLLRHLTPWSECPPLADYTVLNGGKHTCSPHQCETHRLLLCYVRTVEPEPSTGD